MYSLVTEEKRSCPVLCCWLSHHHTCCSSCVFSRHKARKVPFVYSRTRNVEEIHNSLNKYGTGKHPDTALITQVYHAPRYLAVIPFSFNLQYGAMPGQVQQKANINLALTLTLLHNVVTLFCIVNFHPLSF